MNREIEPRRRKIAPSQWRLFAAILVLAVAGITYRLLKIGHYNDSASVYVGLPLIQALGLSLAPKTKSALGATMKGITIALLLSAVVFVEGYICILLALPIFYAVGALVSGSIDYARRRKSKKATLQAALVASACAVLSLEGTTDFTSFPRYNEITESRIISSPVADVKKQLSQTPALIGEKPLFLKIFPSPVAFSGHGLAIGDERAAKFVAYKHIFWTRVEGDLVLRIVESTETKLKFTVVKDDSYLSHYLKWTSSEVFLEPLDAQHTKVTWKLSYQRTLDPVWYFAPMQKYAVRLAAEQLISAAATPRL